MTTHYKKLDGYLPTFFTMAIFMAVCFALSHDAFAAGGIGSDAVAGGTASSKSTGCDGSGLGSVLCNITKHTLGFPALLAGASYLFGLYLGIMGVWKLKEHVEDSRVSIAEPAKRFLAGGAFFALPTVTTAVQNTMVGTSSKLDGFDQTGFDGSTSGDGLDAKIVALMADIWGPFHILLGWFGYVAALLFVIIGISRLLKSEQDGPRGPTGIGTIMTFLTAGALFSLHHMMGAMTNSVFGDDKIESKGVLQYTDGLGSASEHVTAVISGIVAFVAVVGWISFVRGLFIIRGVSEGNSQASMMAAMTHLIGGVIAINLGPIMMAVQTTLGIVDFGIKFS